VNDAKGGGMFGLAVRPMQAVVVDHVTDHSRKVQGTNKHAIMLSSRQRIKLLSRDGQKEVYCAFKGGVLGAEVRGPVSYGQI
jgi:hypothetical protein